MVEWKKLGFFSVVQKTKNKKHITENAYSITQAGLVPTKSFFNEKTNITSKDTSGYYIVEKDWFVYSPSRIDVGSINYLKDEGPVIVSPIDVVFSIDQSICMPSFLLSYFFTYSGRKALLKNIEGVEGMGRRNLPFDAIKNMLIPIPSLEEQKRIMGILDTFTASIDNLKEQIALRRKQYEHYRDQLLDLEGKEGVEMKTLGELFSFKNGLNKGKEFFGKGRPIIMFSNVFNSRSIDASMINNRVDISDEELERINAKVGDVFFTRTSETRDDVGYASVLVQDIAECTFAGFLIRARPTTEMLLPKYCKYCFSTQKVRKAIVSNCSFTTRASLTGTGLGIISLPVPSLSEQQRIVDILDTFEASIQNLEAQLSQREKQYEYYRNKLLMFE